jgi:hypothetical protein
VAAVPSGLSPTPLIIIKIILRGRWCGILVQNIHAQTEDKIADMKGSLCEEQERVFNKFRK